MQNDSKSFIYTDLEELKKISEDLASKARFPSVYELRGDLGVGKTTFSRFFIQSFIGEHIDVPSPTFSLLQIYDTPRGQIWHLDLYRVKKAEEILELGLDDAFDNACVLIEWPDLASSYLPNDRNVLSFSFCPDGRILKILSVGEVFHKC